MENKKIKVAVYCRSANNDPTTIEMQEERLRKFCEEMGYIIYREYKDVGYSATNNNRPAYQQLLKDLKKRKFEKIIIFDFSRLCRMVNEFEKMFSLLKKYNCDLVSIIDNVDLNTPAGLFMARVLNIFCEYERRYV